MVSILGKSMMNVSIDGFVQEMLVDSGSVSNLRGEEDVFKLKGLSLKGKVEHCSKKLFAYGGKQAVVCAGNVKVSPDFVIIKQRRCILGNETVRELGVLHAGPNVAPGV